MHINSHRESAAVLELRKSHKELFLYSELLDPIFPENETIGKGVHDLLEGDSAAFVVLDHRL